MPSNGIMGKFLTFKNIAGRHGNKKKKYICFTDYRSHRGARAITSVSRNNEGPYEA